MDNDTKHNLKWWLKTAGEAFLWSGAYYTTDLLKLFPEGTFINQVALPLGFAISFLIRKSLGMRSEYKKDTLPSGIKDTIEKIKKNKK